MENSNQVSLGEAAVPLTVCREESPTHQAMSEGEAGNWPICGLCLILTFNYEDQMFVFLRDPFPPLGY